MIEIETCIQHGLGKAMAAARVQRLATTLTARFPQQVHHVEIELSQDRIDIQFDAYGYPARWEMAVGDNEVSLKGSLPDSAAPFRRKISDAVVARLEEVLNPVFRAGAA